ncbi:MAG: sel1 repeat family protein [Synergistaceae bacterium]|nr:sel1 repeat family protein [Synergistaceae bacterium]
MPNMSKEDFTREFRRVTFGREGKIDLPDEILKFRCDFLFTANELTSEKLSVSELNQTFIFLAGLLLGKYPQIAVSVKSKDRVRLPYAALEMLPSSKGKLTEHEKLLLSYAVFHAVCTEFYDEKTNKILKGIREIDSPEHAESLLVWDMDTHPERYEFLSPENKLSSSSEPFALSINNPVKAVSVSEGYRYLNRLRTKKGRPVKYHRIGSMTDSRDHTIDAYTLYLLDETMTIYINPYAKENSQQAPEGLILEREDDEYIEELKSRSENGDGRADFELGQKYHHGDGVKQDYKEAFKYYMRSAEQGYDGAMCNIGLMYSRGYGVPQSYKEAAKWYGMAAEIDYPEALHNLGVLYCEGRGVPRDMDKAVELWYRASEKGFDLSQLNLGIMYLSEGNTDEAVKWLKKASENGNEEAMSILADIKP